LWEIHDTAGKKLFYDYQWCWGPLKEIFSHLELVPNLLCTCTKTQELPLYTSRI
jgi:hypothetical protein